MVSSLAGDFDEIAGVVKDGEEEEEVAAEVIVNVEKLKGLQKLKVEFSTPSDLRQRPLCNQVLIAFYCCIIIYLARTNKRLERLLILIF